MENEYKKSSFGFVVQSVQIVSVCALVSAISPHPAYAYLDPGTGSMILQMILAAFVGAGCTFNIWKKKFLNIFKKAKDGRK